MRYQEGLEQRVWSRVSGQERVDGRAVSALAMGEALSAMTYRHLARPGLPLEDLARRETEAAAALRGIYWLLEEKQLEKPGFTPPKSTELAALRRCFVEELRRKTAYEKWTHDPEYGAVFSELHKRKGEDCFLLMQIIGNLQ